MALDIESPAKASGHPNQSSNHVSRYWGAGGTAHGAASVRAMEIFVPQSQRLFDDDLVRCPGDFVRDDSTAGVGVGPTERPS